MPTATGTDGTGCDRGTIFNVQRGSFHDGPGIRTTVFLKGCPLRCPWCHNPEGIAFVPEVLYSATRCLGCGSCAAACPRPGGPIAAGGILGRDGCSACRRCADACPSGAREIAGRETTIGELVAEVLRDRAVYEESGGGVTISGGEPLAQPAFLLALLAACRREGLHVSVDTCGFGPRDIVLAVAARADLLLWDVKSLDSARHLVLTGVPLEPILGNLAAASRTGIPIWLRLPVIPGVNDDDASVARAAEIAARTPSVRRVSLLPYHRTANGKRARLGHEEAKPAASELGALSPEPIGSLRRAVWSAPRRGEASSATFIAAAPSPSPERMAALAALFAPTGIETTIGG